jgi:hypothetical protein
MAFMMYHALWNLSPPQPLEPILFQQLEVFIEPAAGPRILLYITTHMSEQHEDFLQRCWPYTIANSKLVQMADIAVFLNTERQEADVILMRNVFHGKT